MDHAATRKELRQFGLLVGAVFTVIGLWPLVFRGEPLRLWAIGHRRPAHRCAVEFFHLY